MWQVVFTKQAAKDAKKLKAAGLDKKAKQLIELVKENPFATPPSYETLVGNLAGLYSRRISIQHRFVYQVVQGEWEGSAGAPAVCGSAAAAGVTPAVAATTATTEGTVKVIRMWTHYDKV